MNDKFKQSIHDKVCEAIKQGEVVMRPKWHFILKGALAVFGGIIIFLTLILIASLILFVSIQNGTVYTHSFGIRGLAIFLLSIPWLLILIGVMFVILLEILVKHYKFVYRKPLLYSIVTIVVVVGVGGVAVASTSLNEILEYKAHDTGIPIANSMYRMLEYEKPRLVPGTIVEITQTGFDMTTRRGMEIHVSTSSETRFPIKAVLGHGDSVIVIGDNDNGAIEAYGVKRIKSRLHRLPTKKQSNKKNKANL